MSLEPSWYTHREGCAQCDASLSRAVAQLDSFGYGMQMIYLTSEHGKTLIDYSCSTGRKILHQWREVGIVTWTE